MESQHSHRVGGNRKRNQQSTNADQKSIETVFSIAICRQWVDKMAIENTVSIVGDNGNRKHCFY